MRDLLYKNIISEDKKRKIIATSEVMDLEGIRRVIHRHLVCMASEVTNKIPDLAKPQIYVWKEHDQRHKLERFFYKMKGSMYIVSEKRLFLINFVHTLRIILSRINKGTPQCS